MKTYQLIGLIGILFLIICGFLPLAYLDDSIISIYPVFNNMDVGNSLWVWKDISAFAVTYGISLLLCVYLLFRKLKPGYLIAASLNLVAILLIYFSVWLTSIRAEDFSTTDFIYGYTILLVIVGYVLLYFGGIKIRKE